MSVRGLVFFLMLGSLFLQTGCMVLQPMNEMTRQSLRMFRARPTDYRDPTEEENTRWDFVGQEGRGDRPRETDPDPWWGRFIMSEKARSVERNVGVDHNF